MKKLLKGWAFKLGKFIPRFIRLSITLLVIVVPSLYFGYIGKTKEMGIALLTGAIAAAFLNLDRFSSFKGAGFAAELRKVKEDAEETIADIRKIMKPLILNNYNFLINDGRSIGGMEPSVKDNLFKELNNLVDDLDIDDVDIEENKKLFHKCILDRYFDWFLDTIKLKDNFRFIRESLSELRERYPSHNDIDQIFSKYKESLLDLEKESKSRLQEYLNARKEHLKNIINN